MAAHRNQYICSSVFIAPAITKTGGNAKFFTTYARSVNEVGEIPNSRYLELQDNDSATLAIMHSLTRQYMSSKHANGLAMLNVPYNSETRQL